MQKQLNAVKEFHTAFGLGVSHEMKGNLGGPDLFLAPIGRLDDDKITKHFCNTCEKEFEGPPKIEFENPNEEVAALVLANLVHEPKSEHANHAQQI